MLDINIPHNFSQSNLYCIAKLTINNVDIIDIVSQRVRFCVQHTMRIITNLVCMVFPR